VSVQKHEECCGITFHFTTYGYTMILSLSLILISVQRIDPWLLALAEVIWMGEFPLRTNSYSMLRIVSNSDLYDIIFHGALLPTEQIAPASYPEGMTRTNKDGRNSTVEDICDFIVEYINSDVLVCLICD
jgi:hypothetical protein